MNKVDMSDDYASDQGAKVGVDEDQDDGTREEDYIDSHQEGSERCDVEAWRHVLDFCRSHGRRALSIPGVASLVRQSARQTNRPYQKTPFRELYLQLRATRLKRTKEFLTRDRPVAALPLVANTVVRHLPQECTEQLNHEPSRGKATMDGIPWILRCDVQHLHLRSPKLNQLCPNQVEQALNRAPLYLNFERRGLVGRLARIPGGVLLRQPSGWIRVPNWVPSHWSKHSLRSVRIPANWIVY